MSDKRALCSPVVPDSKMRRKSITLETKLEVLKRLANGERSVDIGNALRLPPTTVRSIRSNAEKIKACAQGVTPHAATRLTRHRSSIMANMERLLNIWIEDMHQRNCPCSLMTIQMKAVSLFEDLKKKFGPSAENEVFSASRGWFERFKKRSGLHSMRITGEAASADRTAAAAYPAFLKKIIDEGGYKPQQIFNVDETSLFWKRMPKRTYIAKEEKSAPGFKAAKDRMTVLLGGNASGDMKLKPLVVYHSETPRAMKGYCKALLPVIWRSNKNGWVTRAVFQEWFTKCFSPAVKKYYQSKNLKNRTLLILDNAPGHPPNLDELTDDVQVVFLPPNTTSLLQPMDQGVVATFKACYLRVAF